MKNLDTYIEDLLFKHQCVIIPEFGAFVSNRKAAELAADKSFSPPQKELTFNSRLTYNDGLVAKHISEVERSSYEEAQEYIKSVVTRWKQELSLGQEVRLANIGKFTKGTDNNIIFTSLSKENYLTDSFGMSPVTTKEVSKGETGVEVANPIYNDQNNKPGLVENPSVTPEEAAAGKPKMPLPIKYAAVAIVGLSAIGYAVYSLMTNQENPTVVQVEPDPAKVEELVNQEVAKATYVPEIELTATAIKVTKDPVLVKKRKEELKKQAAERKKAQVAGTTDTPSTTTNTTTSEPTTPKSTNTTRTSSSGGSTSGSTKASGSFFLIAGAFSSESNAQNRVRQLKNSGYSTAGMVGQNEKGYYLVAYRGFSTRAQAESYMPEIKNKGLSTWIYPPAK